MTDVMPSGRKLDESGLEQLLAGLTAVRGGDFSTRLPETGDPLMDQIATVFNGMADQLDLFTSEVTRVAREVGTEGRLGGQADVKGVSGTWKDLTDSVNAMAGNLTGQVRDIAGVATAVAKGDLTQKITVDAKGEMLELKSTLNTMVDQLSGFADEVTRVAREVGSDGILGGQAHVPGVSGTWKDLTESVNVMAANLTDQVRSIAAVTTSVAKGDLTQKIRVDARGEILELKETINTMVDQLSAFADEVTRVAREVGTQGNLGGQAVVRGVSGTWKDLTDNVNVMASNLTAQVRSISQVATAVARGDLSQQITVEAKGEVAALAQAINTMVGTLSAFAGEVTRVAREVGTEGMLGGQANVPNKAGTWKDLTDSVNSMANNLTSQVRNIAQVTTAVAQGDLSKKIDVDARGEILELKTTINTMVDQLSSFAAEVTRVAREVGSDGRLGGQAEVEGVSGTWKRLTENVNELAGNLTRQVRAIAEVTSAVAAGDLTRSISVEAQGEVAELKDNINAMVQSLRETIRANQEQDWLKTNLARLSGLMQGHRDLTAVAELIMDELAPLVGAQHGTFFLSETDDGDTRLRLIAGYGLRADKEAPLQYRLGQSMIGQVAKSKRSIVVADLPEGYVKMGSGLGEASPSNLAVLPILFEDQVLGVIELASFTTFTPVQTDFLEQLTETLGVNVNTIVANSRTDALLNESQRLTAELQARSVELQAQQDELQRSNAELEDKAELLARQNSDIETKNAEIEQAGQEIEERAQQLALASKYKSQFLANMSHELRTPLNSLLILARLLAQNPGRNLTAKQVEYANVIHSAGSDLLQLINDILDLSKVEAGRMDINPERFALRALLEDMQGTFQPLTAEKGLTFAIGPAADAPAEMFTDRQRLRQVLGNLLSNAVKFTSSGRVVLRVGLSGMTAPDGGPMVEFSVTDTGIGIAPENLQAIFGAFQQGDGTLSRRYGGTGLGLSIAREVGTLLGGDITADSALGRGSTFSLHVPRSLPGAQEPEDSGADPGTASIHASNGVAPAPPATAPARLARTAAQEAAARETAAQEAAAQEAAARETAARETATREAAPRETATRETATRETATRETAARETAAQEAAAQQTAAREAAPRETATREAAAREAATREAAPRETATRETAARETAAREAAPRETAARETTARETAAGHADNGHGGPSGPVRGTQAPAQHRVLVLENARGGLLTLLAYSAASDLADLHAPVRVQTVASPEEAIVALRSAPHRCVVLDLGLPGASAFAFLEQLQDEPGLAGLPVLAHARDKLDSAQARLARLRFANRSLELLPSLDELRERITVHLSALPRDQVTAATGTAGTPVPQERRHESLSGRKVLVIDDDARNVFAITSSLEPHGITVLCAPDGRQGISVLQANEGVDLILMDVMMPEMDGYATMAAIRTMPRFAGLPIIAVTARAMQGDREKSLDAGASDYVTKPVDTEELLTCMEHWLNGRG